MFLSQVNPIEAEYAVMIGSLTIAIGVVCGLQCAPLLNYIITV